MTSPRTIPVQPYFGGFVLETLTVGMYGESRNAIREYIQNGFDSIQRAIYELKQLKPGDGLISIIFDEDRKGLTIRDNGAGLPARLAGQTLASIGASRKDYKSDAGFRGIGRLAGIVFSDTVTFRTKASGEAEETEVVFKAAQMRELMSPSKGSERSAEDLLKECVEIWVNEVDPQIAPFFEVKLRGFSEAPNECTDPKQMGKFISQVAPVPYRDDFGHRSEIRRRGRDFGIPIEDVAVEIEAPGQAPTRVFKPYTPRYEVQDAEDLVPLEEVKFFVSPTRRWWGWLGVKAVAGSYLEPSVRGVRVRAKNIQVDGEGVVRKIFQERRSSTARYQDWFVGEIFVDLKALTPNARRDSFEDTTVWRVVQEEIAGSVCKDAGKSAHSISNKGQLTLQKLTEKTDNLAEELQALRRAGFKNSDRTIALSADVTKISKDVARASRNADPETQAALQSLSSQLMDVKTEAVARLTAAQPNLDREQVEHEARQMLLAELLILFEERLQAPCLAAVRNLLHDEYDFPPD